MYTREKIVKEVLVKENDEEFLQLEDIDEEIFEHRLPNVAQLYLEKLKTSMQTSFNVCRNNINLRMNREKWNHDRSIKRFVYKIGAYVLCDHPKLKKACQEVILTNIMVHSSLSKLM